jgi:hypothetical protein
MALNMSSSTSTSRAGRPSIYSLEVARKICELLSTKLKSLRWICLQPGMPGRTTIYNWLDENPEFREMYTVAREEQLELIAEEMIQIADDASNDWVKDEATGKMVPNRQAIARSKLQIGVRQWLLSHILSARYRSNSSSSTRQPRQPVRKPLTDEEFIQRMQEVHA